MIVTIDYETLYSSEYSLSKMKNYDYVLDSRFQTILLCLKVADGPVERYVGHDAAARRLSQIDWSKAAVLAHNNRFDSSILAWRYGYVPKMYLDTLSMARATTHWVLGRSSLKHISDYLGLPPKGDEVVRAIGKRLEDFTPSELQAYGDYCERDTQNCYDIFTRLRPLFTAHELALIDLVLKMYILPQVKLNPATLADYLEELRVEKAEIMARVEQIDKSVFSSNKKFAALLDSYGIEVPTKISPTTGEETFALAKNDRAFKELCEDASLPPEVQAILAARLSTKSTLEETRTASLLDLAGKQWTNATTAVRWPGAGWAPVPIKYSGARTHRFSGDDGTNWQNFKRGSKIREAVEAPAGERIVHRDASQIEARMVARLAGCTALIDAFREGRDVYSEFAASVYGRRVTRADKLERFVGKTGILGLGYGCGPPKFRHMLFIGNGGISHKVDETEARRIVYHYRSEYPEIPQLWGLGESLLYRICEHNGRGRFGQRFNSEYDEKLARLPVTAAFDALWLPSNLCINYPNLRWVTLPDRTTAFVYDGTYKEQVKIYGAKVIENVSQALSRIVVTEIAVRMYAKTGRHPFLSTHDSLDYCVPESEVEWWDKALEQEFALCPDWIPGLPLASEGGWGKTLLDAENKVNE